MIETDPEFYRKVVALNQTSKHKLKLTVTGETVHSTFLTNMLEI